MKLGGWVAGSAWTLLLLGIALAQPQVKVDREVALDFDGVDVLEVVGRDTRVAVELDSKAKAHASFGDDRTSKLAVSRRGHVLRLEANAGIANLDIVAPARVKAFVFMTSASVRSKETLGWVRVRAMRDLDWNVAAERLEVRRLPTKRRCACACSFKFTTSEVGIGRLEVDAPDGSVVLNDADRIGHARLRLEGGRVSLGSITRLDNIELLSPPIVPGPAGAARYINGCPAEGQARVDDYMD